MKTFLYICIFFNVFIYAFDDSNSSKFIKPNRIDLYQGMFSAKVHEWGIGIDYMIVDIFDGFGDKNSTENTSDSNISNYLMIENPRMHDTNLTAKPVLDTNESVIIKSDQPARRSPVTKESILVDGLHMEEFFLTKKLLEERDQSYVRVSFSETFNSLEKEVYTATLKARLYLGRSRKRLRLFIEDFNEDSAKNIGTTNKESPAIGVERISEPFLGIKQRYSLGIHGIDAFVRARYSYAINYGKWRCEPVQTFTYDIKDEFSELTELYMDTPVSDNTLLRFVVDRGTKSGVKGMDYDGYAQLFYRPRPYAGLSLNLGFNGQTHYQNTILNSTPPLIEEENRVFNYLFLMRWRENIWRKWLFYEVGPGVNYHEQHNYRPNYNIYFGLDLFFGHV